MICTVYTLQIENLQPLTHSFCQRPFGLVAQDMPYMATSLRFNPYTPQALLLLSNFFFLKKKIRSICSNILILKKLKLHFQIEHAQHLASGTPDRFGKQGVIASVQVLFIIIIL